MFSAAQSQRFLFQIGVSVESGTIIREEYFALFKRYFTLFDTLGHPYFELPNKLFRVVLHVIEHFFNSFSIEDLVDMIMSVFNGYMHSIGISEEIMHIAENLLICSDQENT